jgi:hypothetical protein
MQGGFAVPVDLVVPVLAALAVVASAVALLVAALQPEAVEVPSKLEEVEALSHPNWATVSRPSEVVLPAVLEES